jgi:hypothetical protein
MEKHSNDYKQKQDQRMKVSVVVTAVVCVCLENGYADPNKLKKLFLQLLLIDKLFGRGHEISRDSERYGEELNWVRSK